MKNLSNPIEQHREKLMQELTSNMENIKLTEEEKKGGWTLETCTGNGYKRGCGLKYKALDWCTPSACPHCRASRVD